MLHGKILADHTHHCRWGKMDGGAGGINCRPPKTRSQLPWGVLIESSATEPTISNFASTIILPYCFYWI